MDNKNIHFLENDKIKLTTLIIGTVIFVAYIERFIYYFFFRINIYDFIDITEVFTPFINKIADIAIINILFWGIIYFIKRKNNKTDSLKDKEKRYSKSDEYTYLILIAAAFLQHTFYIFPSKDASLIFIYILLFIGFLFIIIIDRSTNLLSQIKSKHIYMFYYIQITLYILFYSIIITIKDIDEKKNTEYLKTKYVFQLQDGITIQTDSNLILVGKTKQFFFIYNKSKESVTIYNRSSIIKETISNADIVD